MNAIKGKFAQASAAIAPFSSMIMLVVYLIVAALIFYSFYYTLFPAPDEHMQTIIPDTRSASQLNETILVNSNVTIETGGEYTFQTWIYVSNWDYKAGQPKHVFTIASDGKEANGRQPHYAMIGALYPNENKMMIRVYTDPTTGTSAPSQGPDFTIKENTQNLFNGSVGMNMFDTSVGFPICDIHDIDLQKWICLTIVVNGRVIDVYVDGKLARSCVTNGIPTHEVGNSFVSLGKFTGWGGNISTTRMFGYALTPGKIYEIYQVGPSDTSGFDAKYGFLGWLGMNLGLVKGGGKATKANQALTAAQG